MRGGKLNSKQHGEAGVVVVLVAVFMLFVIGAMAALAVDLVTFYTARSEAQQGADAGALAGARVLANSGMTSGDPLDSLLESNAKVLAVTVATQVATANKVGGAVPTVVVNFPNFGAAQFHSNPQVSVQVSRTDLPVFFSRVLGRTAATVKASSTAEAYNPSGLNTAPGVAPSVALTCVKPWLLPNLDPTSGGTIFDPVTGAISNHLLLGKNSAKSGFPANTLRSACAGGDCGSGSNLPAASKWRYYPAAQSSFPAPTQSLPTCTTIPTPTAYQLSIAGCVQTPITCQSILNKNEVDIDTITFAPRAKDTADAVNCLTHANTAVGDGDVADPLPSPDLAPFTFQGGAQNPIVSARSQQVVVSDSLVTVPVIDHTSLGPGSSKATIIGFVQLFLNADGAPAPNVGQAPIQTKIVNMIGCGTNATADPIQGNGTSAVTVRLISP